MKNLAIRLLWWLAGSPFRMVDLHGEDLEIVALKSRQDCLEVTLCVCDREPCEDHDYAATEGQPLRLYDPDLH